VRLPSDLVDAAEVLARVQDRSTAEQLENWARVGMSLDGRAREDTNAQTNRAISVRANEMSFADRLLEHGLPVVVMDRDGRMVKRLPDGAVTFL
jgi:hypothetical protein